MMKGSFVQEGTPDLGLCTRRAFLEKTLDNLEKEIDLWPEDAALQEVGDSIVQFYSTSDKPSFTSSPPRPAATFL
jgi:hypothetical protein